MTELEKENIINRNKTLLIKENLYQIRVAINEEIKYIFIVFVMPAEFIMSSDIKELKKDIKEYKRLHETFDIPYFLTNGDLWVYNCFLIKKWKI